MFTFIELQGFSKRRQLLLPDDEFRAFQELPFKIPPPVTLSQAQAVLEKFAGTVLEWGNGVAFG